MTNQLTLGSHLVSTRNGYDHHGIYAGEDRVIHYSGLSDGMEAGPVQEVPLAEFARGRGYTVKHHANPKFGPAEIVQRARTKIGENSYSVFSNNCEHFCEWCINDIHRSHQVEKAVVLANSGGSGLAGIVAPVVVASSGSVAGLSGAGVMSGLASTGGVVGGGAVAGIGILAAAPALAMTSLMNSTVLADNAALPQHEREARSAGRAAGYVGAAAGTAGSIGAVSAMGTVAGLSGAGIASGLAAVGGVVGGGMTAGVVVVAAAPVAVAAAVGWLFYKFW
jgi:hypothetical protein